jgi:hypothetical protein
MSFCSVSSAIVRIFDEACRDSTSDEGWQKREQRAESRERRAESDRLTGVFEGQEVFIGVIIQGQRRVPE